MATGVWRPLGIREGHGGLGLTLEFGGKSRAVVERRLLWKTCDLGLSGIGRCKVWEATERVRVRVREDRCRGGRG